MDYSVVWATSTSHAYVTLLARVSEKSVPEARKTARLVDATIRSISVTPHDDTGPLMGTYQKEVAGTNLTITYARGNDGTIAIVGIG